MKSRHLWQTRNYQSLYKKPLICLVVFCFFISPSSVVLADDQAINLNNDLVNDVVNPNIQNPDSINLPDSNNLVLPVLDNQTNTDPLPVDLPNNQTDPVNDIVKNEDVNNLLNQNQSSGLTAPQGSNTDGTSGPESLKQNKPGVDVPTGALTYSYSINIPKGRNGMTPDISLSYNSQNTKEGSVFGYGWGINIPYIEKINKHGTDKLYNENYYNSSVSGELVESSSNIYISKIENGEFLKYEKQTNGWIVTDKQGKKYYYGINSGSRLDDPDDSTRIYRYMLEKVEDNNGNSINYFYYKNQGQIYPDYITYTDFLGVAGIYKIIFQRQVRSDVLDSYNTAFKITTNYQIFEIDIQTNSITTGKYLLNYTTGNNGVRSLLSAITETKYDILGVPTTLPNVVFSYINNTNTLYDVNNSEVIQDLFPTTYKNSGLVTGDINSDSYTDVIQAYEWNYAGYTNNKKTYVYNPVNSKFETSTNFAPPTNIMNFTDNPYNKIDRGTRVIDLNGDMKSDLIKIPYYDSPDREDNTGTGWNNITDQKQYPNYESNPWSPVFVQDFNADGFPDVLQDSSYLWNNCGGSCAWHGDYTTKTSMNNGTEFDKQTITGHKSGLTGTYAYSPDFTGRNTHFMMDLNGDNLPDFIDASLVYTSSMVYSYKIYINTGNGWILDNSYTMPNNFAYFNQYSSTQFTTRMEIADFNNDGLQDILIPARELHINQGKSFKTFTFSDPTNNWFYSNINYCNCANPYLMFDFDTDGDQDFIVTSNNTNSTSSTVLYNVLNKPNDILSSITLSSGSISNINYKSSTLYKDSSGNLLNLNNPMLIQTVESISTNDGLGNVSKTAYEYADGNYYYNNPDDRKFAGFGKVTQINPDNTKQISYYNQGNTTNTANGEYDDHFSKIGRAYRIDMIDANNNLVKQDLTKLDKNQIGVTNAFFVYPNQTISRIFNGSNSYDTAETYSYDTTTGNLLDKAEYGQVISNGYQNFTDIGNDKRTTEYSYTNSIILPIQIVIKDSLNNKINEKKLYYDNLLFGNASKGNNTKEENWINGANYSVTQKSYNLFGLINSITDARNNNTNINYDIYNLYPTSVINSLMQITNYNYDYNTGKLIRTIDPNGSINEIDYDGFGRPVSERSSSDTSYTTLINKALYTYIDTIGTGGVVPYVKKTVYYSPTLSGISYILMDGLGREIRSINQSGTSFTASDTVYDNMGRVYKKSLPYNFSGLPINYFSATTNNNIITTNYYDSLGRVTSSVNTLGSNTNIYNLNTTTIIDPDNHAKDIVTDAYGKIINVIEHNGASTYTTTYNWDQFGNLIGLTDALGNVRTFTYDAQGNRLSSTDLHEPLDTSYGNYTYKYDKNNNLIQKITPNGDTVDYVYDDLNRLIRESNNSTTQITYTYDTCLNGIGQLCSVNRVGSSLKSFSYNNRGLNSSDLTTLNGKVWSMQYIYDYVGNVVQIKYPDNSIIRYTYNNLGQIIATEKQDLPTGAWQSLITNITYNQLGQKEIVSYANGRTQTYSYDNVHQYQLIRNLLDAPTLYAYPNFIDTQYKWTNTGNLSEKNENFNLMNPQKFTYSYDGLSRLTSVNKTVNAPLVGYTENYSYNAIGNLLSKTGAGSYLYNGTVLGVYANPNAATSVASTNYSYDKNGNLKGWGTVPNNTTLTYNYRNELTNYTKISAPAINNTYLYDYSGDRIKSTTSKGAVYTPNKYFEENGTIKKKYVYLGDQLIATVEVNGTSAPNVYYIHPDYLGGTQIVTDSSGSLKVQDLEYYPFGQILTNSKSSGFDEVRKYTGHQYDNDTGLNFMQARYQNGIEGRFWQQDPIIRELDNSKLGALLTNPQMWNSYSYALNNPLKYVDPDGKFNIKTGEVEKGDTLGGIKNQMNDHFKMNLTMSQIANVSGIKDDNKINQGMFISLPTNDVELHFDNKYLSAYSRTYDSEIGSLKWKATSGKEGYSPISEGNWRVNPADTEYFTDLPIKQIGGSVIKHGLWPGSIKSWGLARTQLSNTDTGVKESTFYIHGGWQPGSWGCIDLTSKNNSFHRWFTENKKPLDLIVKY